MSTEVKDNEVKKVPRGLSVRKFKGEIDQTPEEKDKTKKKILGFLYERIVCPWNRTGKDFEDKEVTGSVPSMSEVIAYCMSLGATTEFDVAEDGTLKSQLSVVGLLLDGVNKYLNSTARTKAENTPESAKMAAIKNFAKNMGISNLEEAEKKFRELLG